MAAFFVSIPRIPSTAILHPTNLFASVCPFLIMEAVEDVAGFEDVGLVIGLTILEILDITPALEAYFFH